MLLRLLICLCFSSPCLAQQELPLYPGEIPNSKKGVNTERHVYNPRVDTLAFDVSLPTITVFQPLTEKANGTAIIIFPGGGYQVLLTKREGSDIAKAFNQNGITAFVVKYRLPDDSVMINKSIGPLQDAQQAIRFVRSNAAQWNLDPSKIGVMGFSAGGHLAASASTLFKKTLIPNPDHVSVRPDFSILINPVISFSKKLGHPLTIQNLLGKNPSSLQRKHFSNELNIDDQTPPAMLIHAVKDTVVVVENSLQYFEALRRRKIQTSIHVYANGEHGLLTAPSFDEWFGRCLFWLEELGLYSNKPVNESN